MPKTAQAAHERAQLWLQGLIREHHVFSPSTPEDDESRQALEAEERGLASFQRACPLPRDPWGNPYRYGKVRNAAAVTWDGIIAVGSLGPDGEAGTADDIWCPRAADPLSAPAR